MAKKEKKNKTKSNFDKKELFVRIMSAILAILMIAAVASTCVYYLINL